MNKIRKRPKKATITITLILVSIFLLACTDKNKSKTSEIESEKETKLDNEEINNIGLEIYEGLKNKDKDRIEAVFSKNQMLKHHRKIDKGIGEAFEFINGEIVDYNSIYGGGAGGKVRNYEWIEKFYDGYIDLIQTDTGKEYTINYGGCLIDDKDSDNIGIFYFEISEKDSDSNESIFVGTYN